MGVRGITWFLGVVLAKISSWDAQTVGRVKKSFPGREDIIKVRINHILHYTKYVNTFFKKKYFMATIFYM